MKVLQCMVADDEPIARQILEKYIQESPNLELAVSCKNAFEVIEQLQDTKIDLLFLDINMPKLSGISLLRTIKVKPAVIITTAYAEYAVEGFDLAVSDYLLKPFSFERFLQAVMKVRKEHNMSLPQNKIEGNVEISVAPDFIFVKSDKKIIKLNYKSISHVEAYGNYVKIYAEKMILTPQTLTDFLLKLPHNFVRIHKSFVVNIEELDCIDGNQVVLKNNTKLPIGKSYKKEILEKIL